MDLYPKYFTHIDAKGVRRPENLTSIVWPDKFASISGRPQKL
jgi:hypothetical protein